MRFYSNQIEQQARKANAISSVHVVSFKKKKIIEPIFSQPNPSGSQKAESTKNKTHSCPNVQTKTNEQNKRSRRTNQATENSK